MTGEYLVGVDAGTQSSKVVIFDLDGNIVCEGRQALKPMHLPRPGVAEHPDDDLWDSIVVACREAMRRFPGRPEEILGMGLCTIRYCRCFVKADGTLALPALSWMDTRVARRYEHVDPAIRYVTTSSGYITHRFTGEFRDTVGNSQGLWPIDIDNWKWSDDPETIDGPGIPLDMLFELQMPGTILGRVTANAARATGLPEGLPVVATSNDKAVEALGAGLLDRGNALMSLGTYIAAMMPGHENLATTQYIWTNFASTPNDYLYESPGIRRGMWTVSWFRDLLGEEVNRKAELAGIAPEDYLNSVAEKVPAGSDGLMTVLDWLAPNHLLFKKGLMIGFDGRHGAAHMYRSILEGVALTMKTNLDGMTGELGVALEHLIVSGGGSSSALFMQIFSDVFGMPTVRNVVNGSASVGSAICAAVAVGVYDSFRSAAEHMVRVRDSFHPNAENHALYTRMNDEVYRQIPVHTDEVLKKSYPIFR